MAKKKNVKAGAKKKATAKSKAEENKKQTRTQSTSTAQNTSTAKTNGNKKANGKKEASASQSKQSKTKKAGNGNTKNITYGDILFRKFDQPDNMNILPAKPQIHFESIPDSPPFFDTADTKKHNQLKQLLMKTIKLPRPKIPVAQLIKRSFALPVDNFWIPQKTAHTIPEPPPFFDPDDSEMFKKGKALLMKTIKLPKPKIPIAQLIRKKFIVPVESPWSPPSKEVSFPEAPPIFDDENRKNGQDLLMRKFKLPKPKIPVAQLIKRTYALPIENLWSAPTKEMSIPEAPPIFDSEKCKQGQELLMRKFKIPKPKIPVAELNKRTFALPAENLWSPPQKEIIIPDSPPYFTNDDPAKVEKLRSLLLKKIDLDQIEPKTETEPQTAPEPPKTAELDPEVDAEQNVLSGAIDGEDPSSATGFADEVVLETNKQEVELMSNSLKCVFAGIVAIFIMLYIASSSNYNKYYLVEGKSGVEVWQGIFSPMGQSHLLSLIGMEMPEPTKETYTQEEVFPLICAFYLDQANEVLAAENIPNLLQVKENLELAKKYATEGVDEKIQERLNGIDFMMFVLKADLAMQKGTADEIKKAQGYIDEASQLAQKNYQKDMIKNRLQFLKKKSSQQKAQDKALEKPEKNEPVKPEKPAEKKSH